MSERPYARIYHEVMSDDKFDGIRENPTLFGSWALLLVLADMAYPAPAYVPPTVSRKSVARLAACGLIDELPGHRYRVHGLASERQERSQSASNAAALRWQSKGNAEPMPSKAEQSKDETSKANARVDLSVFRRIVGRDPSLKQRVLLDDVLARHDVIGAKWAADVMEANQDDPIGAVLREDKAWRAEQIAKAVEAERKPRPEARPRGEPTRVADIQVMKGGTHAAE